MKTPTPQNAPTGLRADSPEEVRLRKATLEDAAALALIGSATFLEAYTWMLPGADILAFCTTQHTEAKYAEALRDANTSITLAVANQDVPVGYAMLTRPDLPTVELQEGDLELKRIYVFSRFRAHLIDGVKTSQALIHTVLDDARRLRARRVLLGTHASNARAIAFYQRNGFEIIGERRFQVGEQNCADYILARTL